MAGSIDASNHDKTHRQQANRVNAHQNESSQNHDQRKILFFKVLKLIMPNYEMKGQQQQKGCWIEEDDDFSEVTLVKCQSS